MTLSLCMIVKNEADCLADCLASVVGVVDEIVVVDTGSTDDSGAIAQGFGARVIPFEWVDDFSAARNESLRHATGDWILVLDADERLEPDHLDRLPKWLGMPNIGGYALNIQNKVKDGEGDNCQLATIFRLFRNRPEIRYEGIIHEQVILSVQRAGFITAGCDLQIVHLGYTSDMMDSRDKLNRNLGMLERQAELEPDNPYVYFNLGQTLKMMERLDEAEANYVKALAGLKASNASTAIPFYANLYFNLGDLYRQTKNFPRAHEVLDEGIAIYPDFPDLHYTKGFTYLDAEDYRSAIPLFERCLTMKGTVHAGGTDPAVTSHKANNALGVCYAKLGENTKAKQFLKKAIDLNPAPDSGHYTNLGILHLQDDELSEALNCFVAALELDDTELRAWINLATISYRLGKYQEALDAWEHAMQLDPEMADARLMRAETLMRLGRWDEAIADLSAEAEQRPERANAWLSLGLCQWMRGDDDAALSAWSRVPDETDAQALVALHGVLAGEDLPEPRPSDGDLARVWGAALELALTTANRPFLNLLLPRLEDLGRLVPGLDIAMGQVLGRQGCHQEALQCYLRAQANNPKDAGIYVALGDTCLALGNPTDAKVMFAKAVELAPYAPYPRRQLAKLGASIIA